MAAYVTEGAVSAIGPWLLSASRPAHAPPSEVSGSTNILNVVEVFSDVPLGSIAISTESVRQCRLQSFVASSVPICSSVTSAAT